VQIDVREQRRDDAALRGALVGVRQLLPFEDARIRPLADQAQNDAITYPATKNLPQPFA
jgi:hypothetical protein